MGSLLAAEELELNGKLTTIGQTAAFGVVGLLVLSKGLKTLRCACGRVIQ